MADESQQAGEQAQAQEQVATEQAATEQAATEQTNETKPHALEPGGERFQQVWARAKAAETKAQEEREARIRAEAEATVLREARASQPAKTDERTYTWAELKQMSAAGQITEDAALDYLRAQDRKSILKEAEESLTAKLIQQSQTQRLSSEIDKYKDAVPDVNTLGTDERVKFDREFRYQVEVVGLDPKDLRTQLTALRAVYGSPEKAAQYAKARVNKPATESYQETSGGNNVQAAGRPQKAWQDSLTPREKAHYERMISKGRYGPPAQAWANVQKEVESYSKLKDKYAHA